MPTEMTRRVRAGIAGKITEDDLLGTERRWRRGAEAVPAAVFSTAGGFRAVAPVRPLAWLPQQRPVERRMMRLMWESDGVKLFESARRLHKQAVTRRAAEAAR